MRVIQGSGRRIATELVNLLNKGTHYDALLEALRNEAAEIPPAFTQFLRLRNIGLEAVKRYRPRTP